MSTDTSTQTTGRHAREITAPDGVGFEAGIAWGRFEEAAARAGRTGAHRVRSEPGRCSECGYELGSERCDCDA